MNDNETVEKITGRMRRIKLCIPRGKVKVDDFDCIVEVSLSDFADRIEAAHRRDKCEWAASLTSLRALVNELVGNADYFLKVLDPSNESDWYRWLTKTRMSVEKAREVCKCAL